MVGNFTAQAIIKIMKENKGQGIIAQDEIYNTLSSVLKRSNGAADSSGERQMLLSAWNGGSIKMSWASKEDTCIQETAISLGGMTQPGRLMEVLQDICQVHDGLWERMLVWCLPRAGGNFKTHKKARTVLEEKYPSMVDLGVVMSLIYAFSHHQEEETVTLQFEEEAEELLASWYNRTQAAVRMDGLVERDPDEEDDSEDEEEDDPIETPAGVKLVDQIAKVNEKESDGQTICKDKLYMI